MLRRIRPRLTYANVMASLAFFVALSGGAYAVTSVAPRDSVVSSSIKDGQVKRPDLAPGAVNGSKVADGSLTGADIANRSGVDTCRTPLVARFGPICAGSDGVLRTWRAAVDYCAGFGLRLPSLSEAVALAEGHDVPGVPGANNDPYFWTDEEAEISGVLSAREVDDDGNSFFYKEGGTNVAVCVTDPSA